ncbi:MAG: carbohydrate kinase [Gemmiger sp.]|nr:carbohydrate kinase [Gemmiger sp.]
MACALGEMLIDFTMQGKNEQGQRLFAQNAGGAPANVMAAMAKLGARTAFIGKAGQDMHGKFLKETLEKCAIDCTGFVLSEDYFTTLAFVDIKENGEREFSFARNHGADKMLEKSDVPLDIIRNSGIFHVGSVSLTDDPARSTTLFAVQKAKEAGVVVSYDPNYRASLWKDEKTAVKQMRSMIKYADLMKISEEETTLLTGEEDCVAAANILLAQGVNIVVVTLAEKGAYVAVPGEGRFVKGFKSAAVDATGAGDSFWGGFLYQFSRCSKEPGSVSIDEAADFAAFGNAVASVCVEQYGAIPAMPDMAMAAEKMEGKR